MCVFWDCTLECVFARIAHLQLLARMCVVGLCVCPHLLIVCVYTEICYVCVCVCVCASAFFLKAFSVRLSVSITTETEEDCCSAGLTEHVPAVHRDPAGQAGLATASTPPLLSSPLLSSPLHSYPLPILPPSLSLSFFRSLSFHSSHLLFRLRLSPPLSLHIVLFLKHVRL